MKKLALLFVLAMIFTLGNAPMGSPPNEVILNADQVTSARDIESAIDTATANGTRPGIVTLDASHGDFVYTEADSSINVYVSNLTLRSQNGAVIANCGDGVFFDDFTANNIVIEGITFICEGCGVVANNLGEHHNAIVRNNAFYTGSFAIEALQGDGWHIIGNRAVTPGHTISLYETGGTQIRNNTLHGFIGIHLYNSGYENVVIDNKIVASWQGILLSGKTLGNEISGNKIAGVEASGISFGEIIAGNRVTGNLVSCKPGYTCLATDAYGINLEQNIIKGNVVVIPH